MAHSMPVITTKEAGSVVENKKVGLLLNQRMNLSLKGYEIFLNK